MKWNTRLCLTLALMLLWFVLAACFGPEAACSIDPC